jgi:hypothetical protein
MQETEGEKMKKFAVVMLVIVVTALSGCGNQKLINTQFKYEYATLYTPNGTEFAKGKVEWWRDYDDGTIDIKLVDNDVFLIHSNNVIMQGKQRAW